MAILGAVRHSSELLTPPYRTLSEPSNLGSLFSVRDFVQPTRLYIVDKSSHGHGLGNPWV